MLWQANVFKSCVPVSQSVHRGRGSHVTITQYALDLTVQPPPPVQGPGPLLGTSGGQN